MKVILVAPSSKEEYMSRTGQCLFCSVLSDRSRPILAENSTYIAVPDMFPVNRGHTLIVPKRHVTSLFDLSSDEMAALAELLALLRATLDRDCNPDGYNIGVNEGEAAGQTISHLHIHVIPRYKGDVEIPRGGIRNIKTPLVPY